MAKGDHTDLYMTFVDSGGNRVPGESRADLTSSDQISKTLLDGFTLGFVFEIERFTLAAQADDPDANEIRSSIEKENRQPGKPVKGAPPTPTMTPAQMAHEVKSRLDKQNGPPVREVNFTRTVDTSSGFFMGNIVAGKGYKKATLIKRKSAGS